MQEFIEVPQTGLGQVEVFGVQVEVDPQADVVEPHLEQALSSTFVEQPAAFAKTLIDKTIKTIPISKQK